MKIKFDIEATPQELRTFFGLPDVETIQKEMLEQIRKKMLDGAEGFDPISLMKPLLPEHMQSMSALQKSFWDSFTKASKEEKED
jgi:Family of unknown function (DUF6489)